MIYIWVFNEMETITFNKNLHYALGTEPISHSMNIFEMLLHVNFLCVRKILTRVTPSDAFVIKSWDSMPHQVALAVAVLLYLPFAWASVHWVVQYTLECHWNATGWPKVHWDTTGRPSEYLQGTLEHHWKNLIETAPHWNATGET